MSVVALVVNHNGLADTRRCVESLSSCGPDLERIVVVDNASDDGSLPMLSEFLDSRPAPSPQCELLCAEENRGYGAGNNVGIGRALSYDPRFVWVLNNDTTVTPTTLRLMLAAAERPPAAAVVGSTVADMNPPHRVQYVGGGTYDPWLTRHRYPGRGRLPDEVEWLSPRVDYVGGANMLIRADVLRNFGGFNEVYHLYFEELDFARRLAREGRSIRVEPRAVVYHRGGASINGGSTDDRSPLSMLHGTRSCIVFQRRWQPMALPAAIAVRAAYGIALTIRRPRLGFAALKGLVRGLSAGPDRIPSWR